MTATPSDAYADRQPVPAPRSDADGLGGRDADARGGNRHRRPRRRRRAKVLAVVGVAGLAVVGAGYTVATRHSDAATADAADRGKDGAPRASAAAVPGAAAASASPTTAPGGPVAAIAGLGPKTRSEIPAATRQVLVASGKAKNSSDTVVTLWTRTGSGSWQPGAAWPAHNALRGWTGGHRVGDLHSPIGVFTLSDAGGFDPDPGSKLPYHHSAKFRAGGVGFNGEPLDQAFDYVIAINYNRVPGTSPLDGTQPMGASRGGGIWVHVDHGGPTHGCVSISAAHMVDLLHTLQPADHPVIVMGDRGSLAA
ncbi:L,D-transpeptidase family protein [Actinacidiphila bryophytorum]|uniref:L,D-peptidoglycan transpeptidase YkuD, ErfK/YbiS/YcfS/YnhG family n=1 Tax=Actinacidiphila bryophytorum TaxID=1436133 RepID=A0A9W4H5Z3_9ACTN|nr:L,D-transpeptidase family protein [Actinacidiphila bryophytorum]MBM9439612.1 L,D-transpeptidase family protein [Actinacidiphila bryophytorum]MBN6543748.1 L,D-transpeptidase family protein [Actinacidiphila bryophytorum]CAG7653311.1 L,D-peptidoglycan transpeptidase YkuD, ErfK/YbiS/YcfS/YnhG family [Actinacidiphila bryophytorum]